MSSIKKLVLLAAWGTLFVSFPLQASMGYVCTQGDQERQINISYAYEGERVPCQVTYVREDGSAQSLWNAQNAEGYCEKKAAEFAEKQRGWGWDCSEHSN